MQPDSIFKEKLESLRMTPPEQAWSKIEAGLNQKKNNFIWLKVAASLVLIAVTSYLLWPQQEMSPLAIDTSPAVDQTRDENQKRSDVPLDKITLLSDETVAEQQNKKNKIQEHQKVFSENKRKTNSAVVNDKPQTNTTEDISLAFNELPDTDLSDSQTMVITQSKNTANQSFKMVIEVNNVNDLYLKKKSTSQATADEQKTSGIKRLIDKAQDLKNNQDPLGELRIKKNELFAFNLQSNKKNEREKQIGYE